MRLGVKSKLYVNTGTYDAPTWAEVNLISDLNVNGSWEEDDSSTRAARVKTAEQTLISLELTGKIRKEILNTPFLIMRAAFNNASTLDFLILDGSISITGSEGYRFVGSIFNWSEDQSLGKVIFKDFSVKPSVYLDGNGNQVPPVGALTTAPDTVAYSTLG